MENSVDTSSKETVSDFIVEMMTDEKDGEEFTREYLKAKFLSSVGRSLYYARRKAGLTQEQVAERMNTQQPAIARLEADKNGSMSFRRYVDFALACGMMPRSLMLASILEPIDSLRDEMIVHAAAQHAQDTLESRPTPIPSTLMSQIFATQSGNLAIPLPSSNLSNQESTLTVSSVERYLKEQQSMQVGQTFPTWPVEGAAFEASTIQAPASSQSTA